MWREEEQNTKQEEEEQNVREEEEEKKGEEYQQTEDTRQGELLKACKVRVRIHAPPALAFELYLVLHRETIGRSLALDYPCTMSHFRQQIKTYTKH